MIKTIGYVSETDPFVDKKAWSGSIYKIREGIENAGYTVKWIPVRPSIFYTVAKIVQKLIYGRHAMIEHTCLSFYIKSLSVKRNLDGVDALFFPGGAQVMRFIKTTLPVIYYGDATYHQMIGYYWEVVSKSCCRQGDEMERAAISRSDLVIKASQWTIDSVIGDYRKAPEQCHVLELGANLEDKDIVPAARYDGGTLNVLFSGVAWERKGAAIAMDTVRTLNNRGVKAKLIFCGINTADIPEEYRNLPYVEYLGFLNKNIAEQYDAYIAAIKRSHILLLPTKAECAGIVFSEASAYGLPIFTHDTGGIPNYVIDGVNGYKLPLGSTSEDFADKIQSCIDNHEFDRLAAGGRQLYAEKLSWKAWGSRFKAIMEEGGL